MAERADQLRRAAQARHDAAFAKATTALGALGRDRKAVTFGALARAAGVSRSWLYRQPELRARVDELRQSSGLDRSRVVRSQRATEESTRQQITLCRAELARLQAENRSLREQLARRLGEERAAAVISLR